MPNQSHFPTIGIVGGGQLARMMIEAASRLNLKTKVLCESASDSAALIASYFEVGDYKNLNDLEKFSSNVDVLTFDHEHVPLEILKKLEKSGIKIRPGLKALSCVQDKSVMREVLGKENLAIPKWKIIKEISEIETFASENSWPLVIKTTKGGYDGKGVWVVENLEDAKEILKNPLTNDAQWMVEEFVKFKRELAVHVARSPHGQSVVYPVVQSTQKNGVCDEVIAPAPGLSEENASKIQALALNIAQTLEVTGVFSVELFELENGEVLINELAMRPHNSGHWSIDGAVTSQFENHLRAILDLPLGSPKLNAHTTVMVNILGGKFEDMYKPFMHCMARDPELRIHLYGKQVKPGRKVGHVNISGKNVEDLLSRAHHAADYLTGTITE